MAQTTATYWQGAFIVKQGHQHLFQVPLFFLFFFKSQTCLVLFYFSPLVILQGAEVTFPYNAEVNQLIPVHPDK